MEEPTLDRHFDAHSSCVTDVNFSSDCTRVISGGIDGVVKVWKLRNNLRSLIFNGADSAIHGPVLSVDFCPQGRYIAAAASTSICLWMPELKSRCRPFRASTSRVRCVRFSPDSLNLVTAADDKAIKVFDVETNKFLYSFQGHQNWVRFARFSRAGTMVASCSDDKTAKIWDTRSQNCVNTFSCHTKALSTVDFDFREVFLATGGSDDFILIWDTRMNKLFEKIKSPSAPYCNSASSISVDSSPVHRLTFHPSAQYLAVASAEPKVRLYDTAEGRLAYTLHGHQEEVGTVAFGSTGFLASGDTSGEVYIWNTTPQSDRSNGTRTQSTDSTPRYWANEPFTYPRPLATDTRPLSTNRTPNELRTSPRPVSTSTRPYLSNERPLPTSTHPLPTSTRPLSSDHPPSTRPLATSTPPLRPNCLNQLPSELSNVLSNVLDQLETLTESVIKLESRVGNIEDSLEKLKK